MRLLLDTHLLLWWLEDNDALTGVARVLIGDPGNTIFISAVTWWEIRIKQSLGKLKLPADFAEQMGNELFENLPLTASQTRELADLPWHHRDPFDRMLIAQAKAENLLLLSSDAQLAQYGACVKIA